VEVRPKNLSSQLREFPFLTFDQLFLVNAYRSKNLIPEMLVQHRLETRTALNLSEVLSHDV
jgi:hypothetical protein